MACSLGTTTSGRGERGELLHRRGGPQADARRRAHRLGRDVAPRGEAAAVSGVRSACSTRTVVHEASGRTAPRLIEATLCGHGPRTDAPARASAAHPATALLLARGSSHEGGAIAS